MKRLEIGCDVISSGTFRHNPCCNVLNSLEIVDLVFRNTIQQSIYQTSGLLYHQITNLTSIKSSRACMPCIHCNWGIG